MKKTLLAISCLLLFLNTAISQNKTSLSTEWLKNVNSSENNAFVENVGQFDEISGTKNKGILYQLEASNMQVSFTSKGVIYLVSTTEKVSERGWEEYVEKNHIALREKNEKNEANKERYIPKTAVVEMNWAGANSNFEISAEELTSFYFNFYRPDIDKDKVFGNVKGFKKIIYKNVYPFIDVEYTIHPKEGIKYSYILHPGANPSSIKMNYTGATIKLDENNDLQFITNAGNITDHAPLTYKGEQLSGKIIESAFELTNKNTIGFKLENTNTTITETTVIDPWQVGPGFPANGYTPNDLAVDGSGNVLVYSFRSAGSGSTQRIDKYNSAGVFQWTFNLTTGASYSGIGQGDVAADPAGNVYACNGLGATTASLYNTIKLNPAGTALIWGTTTGGLSTNDLFESWTITFNCDYTQFYQSGGGLYIGGTVFYNVSTAEPVNATTGAEGVLTENDTMGEIYCTYYAPNALLYHMAADSNAGATRTGAATTGIRNTLTCINPGTGAKLFRVQLGYAYVDGDLKAPGSVGMNAMASSCQYLYTMNGAVLDRWNPTTGAHFNQITIPGGSTTASATNAGILTDKCGNVYVGSANGNIYVYNPTLTLINTIAVFGTSVIFDIAWANAANTEIVACGGTSNATTFLKSVAVPPCVLPNQVTVTPTQPTCIVAGSATATATFCGAPYTYSWSPSGGTGATATGLGAGVYTVTVSSSISCPYSYVQTQTVSINAAPGSPTVTVNSAAICSGNSTTLTAGGATTYSWSPGTGLSATTGASVTANPTVTTTYTIVGTAASCTASITSTVTVNPKPTVTVNSAAICQGGSTVLTAGGASTYSWTTATGLSATTGASVTANPSVTTTYTITGTSAASCTATITSTVTVNPTPTVAVNSTAICAGSSTTLNASGAATYSWSPGTGLSGTTGASVTANPTVTTTYTVVGTAASCTASITSTVTVNPTPTVAVNSATICSGNSTTLTAGGATTYSWSPGTGLSSTTGASVTANPTVTTTYTVVGTTASCTASITSTVTVNPTPTVTVNSAVICAGSSTTLNASGAVTYSWSPGTGLSATTGASVTANPSVTTTYTITGTSAASCTATITSTVTVNPTPTVAVNSATICSGNSTPLTAGGATTYSWSPGTGLSSTTGASVTANPTVTTTYTVVGTAASCTASITSTVTVNPTPTVTVNSATICPGATATLTANGASTYSWSPGTGLSATTGASVSANPTVTTTYTITASSVAGCTATTTSTVTVGGAISPTANNATICSGSSATLTANGATTYTWSPATGLSATTGASVTANPTVTTTYTINAASGACTGTVTSVVTVNPLPVLTVNSGTICIGQQTATLTANGASTYSWNPGTGLSATTGASVTANPTLTTNYTVTGSSAAGCVNTAITVVTVNPLPVVGAGIDQTICSGLSVTLNGSGATTYTWSGGVSNGIPFTPVSSGSYTVVGEDSNGCLNSDTVNVTFNSAPSVGAGISQLVCSGGSITLNGTGAVTYTWTGGVTNGTPFTPGVSGSYTVTGTDINGCTNSDSLTITVNPTPTVSAGVDQTVCSGGSITLSGSGATTYTWSGGITNGVPFTPGSSATYTVTGADANGCTNIDTVNVIVNIVSPVSAGANQVICIGGSITLSGSGSLTYTWTGGVTNGVPFTPGGSGTYTVTATDANGCFGADSVIVTVNSLPVVGAGIDQTICPGLSVTLSGSGATTYTWTGGVSNGIPFTPVSSGSYTVVGEDANGCLNSDTVNVIVGPPIIISGGPDQTFCAGGSATLSGSGALTYTWTGGVTNGVPFTPASSGSYTVFGTDAGGCNGFDTVNITVNPLPTLTITASPGSICAGQTTTLTANGASTYTWSTNAGGGSVPTVTVSPSISDSYTVTGDALGCIGTQVITINVNPLPTISAGVDQTVCAGGSVTLSGSGGLIYVWTGGVVNGAPFTPVSSGSYTVAGIDINGCSNIDSVNVTVNAVPIVGAGVDQTFCIGGTATLSGSGAITYTWTGGVVNGTPFTPTSTGSYTVTGTGANGCTNTDSVTIIVNPLPIVNAGADQIICIGASVTLSGGGATTYTWSGGVTNGTSFTPGASGSYTLVGTDANGCVNTDVVNITVNSIPIVTAGADQSSCAGSSVTLSGGGAATYTWTGGVTNGTPFTPASTGSYTVTGADVNGCTNTDVVNVTVNPLPTVNAGASSVMPCGAISDTLNGTTNAATPVYSWSGPGIISGGSTATPIINSGGTYTLVVIDNATGCSNSSTTSVTTTTMSVAFTPDVTSGFSPVAVIFTNSSINSTSYNWVFGNGSTSNATNPGSTFTIPGTYNVMLIGTNGGCIDTAYATILVLENSSIVVPNIFSPNGDNINDLYFITTVGIQTLSADIYNRWGEIVGKIEGVNDGWDGKTLSGKNVSDGTYFYILKATGYDGKKYELHGSFTLLK